MRRVRAVEAICVGQIKATDTASFYILVLYMFRFHRVEIAKMNEMCNDKQY